VKLSYLERHVKKQTKNCVTFEPRYSSPEGKKRKLAFNLFSGVVELIHFDTKEHESLFTEAGSIQGLSIGEFNPC
jgi:hypothetical protein